MTSQQPSHIEPSVHSTAEFDEFLRQTEAHVDVSKVAGSPTIKPTELGEDGKPNDETPKNPET